MIGKRYLASDDDEKGARQIAHEFAADILPCSRQKAWSSTHIYYVHQTASLKGPKEIWVMDRTARTSISFTRFNSLSIEPSVSPDGSGLHSLATPRVHPCYICVFSGSDPGFAISITSVASMNWATLIHARWKADRVLFLGAWGRCCRIFIAGVDGRGFRPITSGGFIDTEPKVNPKTGSLRSCFSLWAGPGPEQIYMMNMDGADLERLTRRLRARHRIPRGIPSGQFDRLRLDARVRPGQFQHIHDGRGFAASTCN